MGEETCEIGHDILILVRAIDEQEVDGLIPSFRHLAAEAHNGLDVLREAGALNVMRKIRKQVGLWQVGATVDRKSTRLNSSHRCISYAVFCLKKKRILYWLSSV